jgi:hypothetical protein
MIGELKMFRKISISIVSILTLITSVLAHNESGQGYYGPGMMWNNGGWMHNGWHMVGYNMWGMGWLGLIPGILIWTLIILGIIYLYQKITEE